MQFTNNNDGTITVTWSAPAVTFTSTGSVLSTSAGTVAPLQAASPVAAAANTQYPTSDMQTGYAAYAVLHVQYGTATANTIKDYSQVLALSKTPSTVAGISYIQNLTTSASSMSITITPDLLADPRIVSGIYAIGYVGLSYHSGLTNAAGTYFLAYDYGTNAQYFQPVPPSAPSGVHGSLQPDGHLRLTWGQSTPGSAPLAGYKVLWSASSSGPYANTVSVPIAAYPPAQTSTFQYDFAPGAFPFSGETNYFTVQAFDDGSAPLQQTAYAPSSISYFPADLNAPPVVPPPAPTPAPTPPPGGGGGKPPGGGNPGKVMPQ